MGARECRVQKDPDFLLLVYMAVRTPGRIQGLGVAGQHVVVIGNITAFAISALGEQGMITKKQAGI